MTYYYTIEKNKDQPERWRGRLYHYDSTGNHEIADFTGNWHDSTGRAEDEVLGHCEHEGIPQLGDELELE